MGNKIALLNAGRLVQYGTPEALLTSPANQFVKDFVGADRSLKRLDLLKVQDAMLKNPVHCHDFDQAEVISRLMQDKGLNYLLVCDSREHLLGYVNFRDIVDYSGNVGARIKPMTLTVRPNSNLKDALSKMLSYDIGIVVAVDDDNELVGILNTMTLSSVVGQTYDEQGGRWGKITAGGKIL
jgi:osmoprotectant transport system ATP-binding protein